MYQSHGYQGEMAMYCHSEAGRLICVVDFCSSFCGHVGRDFGSRSISIRLAKFLLCIRNCYWRQGGGRDGLKSARKMNVEGTMTTPTPLPLPMALTTPSLDLTIFRLSI